MARFTHIFLSEMNTLSDHVSTFQKSLTSLESDVTSLEGSIHTIFATFHGLATGSLSGITIHDAKTNAPYCLDVENGVVGAHAGDCLTYLTPQTPAAVPAPETASPSTVIATTTLTTFLDATSTPSAASTTPSTDASTTPLIQTNTVNLFTATSTGSDTATSTAQ